MRQSFTDLVGCRLPLQLAGMGGIGTDAALPAAVSEAGGLGTLGAGGMPAARLQDLFDTMDKATTQPYGVNFLMPFLDRDAVTLAARRCRLVEFFYGAPDASLIDMVHEGGALAGWQVGSTDEADAAVRAGIDLLIVQGNEAGGHVRGKRSRAAILAETATRFAIPVVAAGGIGTAEDVRSSLDSGASGVRIGTRFLAATESIAHPQYVDALIRASADDTVLTETFSKGWPNAPHRVLRSSIEAANAADGESVATYGSDASLVSRFSTTPPTKDINGNVAAMALYAGTSVEGVRDRKSAAAIVAELCAEI